MSWTQCRLWLVAVMSVSEWTSFEYWSRKYVGVPFIVPVFYFVSIASAHICNGITGNPTYQLRCSAACSSMLVGSFMPQSLLLRSQCLARAALDLFRVARKLVSVFITPLMATPVNTGMYLFGICNTNYTGFPLDLNAILPVFLPQRVLGLFHAR